MEVTRAILKIPSRRSLEHNRSPYPDPDTFQQKRPVRVVVGDASAPRRVLGGADSPITQMRSRDWPPNPEGVRGLGFLTQFHPIPKFWRDRESGCERSVWASLKTEST